ncbi:MAG TPA: ATP-binding protein, partial [Desulfurivibrionaceae bacterium]|nr:ATP-binding protein [Desulfurivibrionaceae bacterium]
MLIDSHQDPSRMENHADRPEIMAALQGRIAPTRRYSHTLQTEMLKIAIPLHKGTTLIGVLRLATPTALTEHRLAPLRRGITLAAVLLFALSGLATWLLSRGVGQPLTAMRRWAADFAAGARPAKLPANGPAPVAELAVALNRMAAQVDHRIDQITQQRNELEILFASMVEGVLAVDAEERIQGFNPAAIALLGLDAQKTKGKNALEVVRNLELQRCIAATLGGTAILERELLLPDHSGAGRSFHLRGVPLKGRAGETSGALIVISDVTNLRRLETVRRDFVANVSHELKTPITAITGFVETLLDGAIDEPDTARRFLEITHQQATRLHAIVEDLLALSRLERETELPLVSQPLQPRIAAAMATCQPAATAKGIDLQQECPADITARLNPALFEQALVNLIDNAIKYSPADSSVRITATADGNGVSVAVKDQGVGIALRDQSRVFERFFRVDKARSCSMGGTGLGLAIVKHIVQAHGGRVSLESTLGKGSTFTIHLP